ncbi:MAG: NAD(P)/FAD-dependent oxidoreductase [Syntrophales bacterium]
MIQILDIRVPLGRSDDYVRSKIAEITGLAAEEIHSFRVVRKSLDARRKRPPEFLYTVEIAVRDEQAVAGRLGENVKYRIVAQKPALRFHKVSGPEKRPVVIGCGPAGLFSALVLAMSGIPALLLEKGKKINERQKDVRAFWSEGKLNPQSNVHFGEGGAGTFSDGKLTTRVRSEYIDFVKRTFVDMGAHPEIMTDAKPHIGTDRLRKVIVNLRKTLVEMGVEVRFGAAVTGILTHGDKIAGVVINAKEEIATDYLILAAGQSSPEIYRILQDIGSSLAPKAFALGLRVEHRQETINRIQYGRWLGEKDLPPADYFLTARVPGTERSVYSFCMCPGGYVIGASSEPGGIVTNGMSDYLRNAVHANSAVIVNVRPDDFDTGSPISGLDFRKTWEEKAFAAGGGDYFAPAQRLVDFISGKETLKIRETSFRPGVRPARLDEVLPRFAAEALRVGLSVFGKKMPGFITPEAVLIGVETRTSSPVRIVRREDGRSVNIAGLYPCGEGSGYAGGIVSSALDGIRAAMSVIEAVKTG